MRRWENDMGLLEDVFRAYYDARRNKRNTINQLAFEFDLESNLIALAGEIRDGTYKVGRSTCFIVENPVKREIFAADFRDRVVHHFVCNHINDLFEKRFINDCYSCRTGFGTSYGIKRIAHHARSATANYSRTAYVLKLDLQGYFMSIDRALLYTKMKDILTSRKNRKANNTEMILGLLKIIIENDPTVDCLRKGNLNGWDGLPDSKSLFYSNDGCGLPIGNLTSQLFSNIFLTDFDNYVKRELKVVYYGRYVDDFYLMSQSREELLDVLEKVKGYLKQNHKLLVHPKKIYLQEITKGVTFLGAHVKPHRNYISSKTLKSIRRNVKEVGISLERSGKSLPKKELIAAADTLNSYFGYMKQFKTRKLREELWKSNQAFRKYLMCDGHKKKVKEKEIPLMWDML